MSAESPETKGLPNPRWLLMAMVSLMILGALGMVLVLGGDKNRTESLALAEAIETVVQFEQASLQNSGSFSSEPGVVLSYPEVADSAKSVDGAELQLEQIDDGLMLELENRYGIGIKVELDASGTPVLVDCSQGWSGSCPSPSDFAG